MGSSCISPTPSSPVLCGVSAGVPRPCTTHLHPAWPTPCSLCPSRPSPTWISDHSETPEACCWLEDGLRSQFRSPCCQLLWPPRRASIRTRSDLLIQLIIARHRVWISPPVSTGNGVLQECSKTPSGGLKPQTVPSPVDAVCFPTRTHDKIPFIN